MSQSQLSFKDLNNLLSNIEDLRIKKNLISSDEPRDKDEDSSRWEEIYSLNDYEGIYVKMYITENSYGTEEFISGIQFVRPTTKTIETYESL